MASKAVLYRFLFLEPPPIDSRFPTCLCRNDMGGWCPLKLKQASTGMSSLRGLVGKGLGSIAVEAVF
jgi:hypothetical protein